MINRLLSLFSFIVLFFAINAQTISYSSQMKPFIGEWVCEQGEVTMILKIEKVNSTQVTAKYKAINYEDGRPRTFYTDFEKIIWDNGKFIFTSTGDYSDKDLIFKNIATLKDQTLILVYQCWEKIGGNYKLMVEQEIGKFHFKW